MIAACVGALAQPPAGADLGGLNTARRQLGLRPLARDPVAQRVVERMARNDTDDRPHRVLDAQPPCAVCASFFERGLSVDPVAEYRRLGGRGPVRFALWHAGWSAAENLSVFFPAAALVLDPRARTFAAARTPRGMLVVGVGGDLGSPSWRSVRWPPGPIDPRRQLWAEVLLPAGLGYPHLYDTRGRRLVKAAYPLAVARGFGHSRLVAFGLNTSLAYGRGYRVGVGPGAVTLRTRAVPAAFHDRSWSFAELDGARRRTFLAIVGDSPLLLRRLLAELDGAVTVTGGVRACSIADACEEVAGDRARVGFAGELDPFLVLHELGHVVFDLALDERGRRIVLAAFQHAGWREYCCINLSEVFADQLAFWALGAVPPGVDSYSDRLYLSPGDFARLLRENAAYRPAPLIGPLTP